MLCISTSKQVLRTLRTLRTLFAGRNHLFLLILLVLACVKVGGDGVAPPTKCVTSSVCEKAQLGSFLAYPPSKS